MSDFELSDFEIHLELPALEQRELFRAVERKTGKQVLLTVFSTEISQRAEFRRALKTDRAMLTMLQHQSIVRYLGSGETAGQLFLCNEYCELESVASQLDQGRVFSSDDVIEVGWQICSALQQAHNFGLAHGGLRIENVLLSDNLQVMLTEFGIDRWLKAAHSTDDASASGSGPALITISALASRQAVEADLNSLAGILVRLLQTVPEANEPAESSRGSNRGPLERLLTRFQSTNPAYRPVIAREFQGRLGEILIGSDDDSMPLVDHRESMGSSRRSIIVELFEPTESLAPFSSAAGPPAGTARQRPFLPIAIVLVAIVIIALLAGLLR